MSLLVFSPLTLLALLIYSHSNIRSSKFECLVFSPPSPLPNLQPPYISLLLNTHHGVAKETDTHLLLVSCLHDGGVCVRVWVSVVTGWMDGRERNKLVFTQIFFYISMFQCLFLSDECLIYQRHCGGVKTRSRRDERGGQRREERDWEEKRMTESRRENSIIFFILSSPFLLF